jgi:hypothetical protein
MTNRRIVQATLVAGAVAMTACGPRISSDRDESIAIPHGATWAWGARASREGPDSAASERAPGRRYEQGPMLSHEIMHQRFQRALEAGMLSKGFHKVSDPEQADFTLSYQVGVAQHGAGSRAAIAVGTGFYGMWGWGAYPLWGPYYGPWGYGRFGWGPYGRFGRGFYGPPVFGGAVYTGYPYPSARGAGVVVAELRQRSSGQVAWSGQIITDVYDANMPMSRVQSAVNKLLEDLN